jgi:hypothetical protein
MIDILNKFTFGNPAISIVWVVNGIHSLLDIGEKTTWESSFDYSSVRFSTVVDDVDNETEANIRGAQSSSGQCKFPSWTISNDLDKV